MARVGRTDNMPSASSDDDGGPLWTALVEVLNSERSEKEKLKADVELLSKELEHARALHLATFQELKSAETQLSEFVYPQHNTDKVIRTPKQVLDREFEGQGTRPSTEIKGIGTPGRIVYDKSLKLQSTGTPVIGTLTPTAKEAASTKKVRFNGPGETFESPERRNPSRSLVASASLISTASRLFDFSTPNKASTSRDIVTHPSPTKTPSLELLEGKWKERCLTAEYKQKMLEQQVSDLEADVITMSLKLEDKLDLQDKLLVKQFEIKQIDKWQQYVLRKCLLMVRVLSRQVSEAMQVFAAKKDLDTKQRIKGWQLVLRDIGLVVKNINEAGIKIKSNDGKAKSKYDFDLGEKEIEAIFERFDLDGDGLISLQEVKDLLESLKDSAGRAPMKLPAPVSLTLPQEGAAGFKLGNFYKELMSKHKKIKHFGKRKHINVAKLNKLNAQLLKAVYFTYCSFGMGHGEERTHHSNIMDCNNFAKLCRECGIISEMPLAEADIFFAAVTEIYSRNLKYEEFLHALLMVAEESSQELESIITQVIEHGVPEIHVRTKRPMPPILKTASRPEIWQKKKTSANSEED